MTFELEMKALIEEMEAKVNSLCKNVNFQYPDSYKKLAFSGIHEINNWDMAKGELFVEFEMENLKKGMV